MENQNMNELEEMRQQLSLLKNKLNSQSIVNDSLLRNAMKSKFSWVKNYIWFNIFVLCPFAIIMLPVIRDPEGFFYFSWLWYAVTIIYLFIDAYAGYKINVAAVNDQDFNNDNMIEMGKKILKMKQRRSEMMIIETFFSMVWMEWFFGDIYLNALTLNPYSKHMALGFIPAGLFGMAIGFSISFYMFRKAQRVNDDILNQIKTITQEEISETEKYKYNYTAIAIFACLAITLPIGYLTLQIGLWAFVGAIVGLAIGTYFDRRNNN